MRDRDLAQVDDITLWDRVRNGEQDSFEVLVERHMAAVYRYCTRRTGSHQAAEDLTSVVFLEVWRCRARLTAHSTAPTLLPLLYGVAANVCSHHRRSLRRWESARARLAPVRPVDDHAQEVVDGIETRRRLRDLRAAIDRLPRVQREVVELCWVGELDVKTVAATLAIAEGTVKSRLSRARSRLRLDLTPQEPTDGE